MIDKLWKREELMFHVWHHQHSLYYYDKRLTRGKKPEPADEKYLRRQREEKFNTAFRDRKPIGQNSTQTVSHGDLRGFLNPDYDPEDVVAEDKRKHALIKKKIFADGGGNILRVWEQKDPDPDNKERLNCDFSRGRNYGGCRIMQ